MITTNKDKIEDRRKKVEMLEKEANLILKQIVIYLTIWGSIIAFTIKLVDFKAIVDFINIGYFLAFFPALAFFAYASFYFAGWIYTSIFRIREIIAEIKRINNAQYI